jgi:hypothetical protein
LNISKYGNSMVSVKEVYKAMISLQKVCIYICSWCMVHIYTSEKGERSLRCAKTMVEKEYHKLVPISCEGGPRNSSFIRCSRTHITKPMKTKKHPLVIQRTQVKGFKNTHAFFLSLSLIGTIIDTPDSVYGNVKSTKLDLFAMIVVSPATASKFCQSKILFFVISSTI